jgi:putative transposase
MSRPHFVKNHIYHVFNRGVDKRDIFLDDQDYYRFIHDLFEFNDENPVTNVGYFFNPQTKNVESRYTHPLKKERPPRKFLVDILVFTLMPNHFHLMLRQKAEGGVTTFMRKMGTGYTNYFNKKYERSGVLFQGKFKAVLLDKQEHFQYLPSYIHFNPLSLIYRSRTSIDGRKALTFLKNYRWSSFPDYIGKSNFPSVTEREVVLGIFRGAKNYKKHTKDFLREWDKTAKVKTLQDVMID